MGKIGEFANKWVYPAAFVGVQMGIGGLSSVAAGESTVAVGPPALKTIDLIMSRSGEGARAVVFGHRLDEPGHILNAVVEDGKVVYIDSGQVVDLASGGTTTFRCSSRSSEEGEVDEWK